MMLFSLDIFGTVVFAFSGILLAYRMQIDLFGALVLATATAIGGGTLRDVLLGQTPFWMTNDIYLYVIIATCVVSYFGMNFIDKIPQKSVRIADAIGLAAFTVIGVVKAQNAEMSALICIVMGVMTGVAGGVIRDTLANNVPMVFVENSFYATAAFFGGLVIVLLAPYLDLPYVMVIGGLCTLILRLTAIYTRIGIPYFKNYTSETTQQK